MYLADVDMAGCISGPNIHLEHALAHGQIMHVHLAWLSEIGLRERVVVLCLSVGIGGRLHGLSRVRGCRRILPDSGLLCSCSVRLLLGYHLSAWNRLLVEVFVAVPIHLVKHLGRLGRLPRVPTAYRLSWQALLGRTALVLLLLEASLRRFGLRYVGRGQ